MSGLKPGPISEARQMRGFFAPRGGAQNDKWFGENGSSGRDGVKTFGVLGLRGALLRAASLRMTAKETTAGPSTARRAYARRAAPPRMTGLWVVRYGKQKSKMG